MSETLANLVVTPEDVERTYRPMHHTYRDYQEVMQHAWKSEENTFGDLARSKGIRACDARNYKKLDDRFGSWVRGGRVPPSVKAIQGLHEMGVFPDAAGAGNDSLRNVVYDEIENFDCANRLYPALNLLSAVQYWRGSFLSPGKQPDFRVLSKFADSEIKDLIATLMGRLPGTTDTEILINALNSRFLKVLGASHGNRNNDEFPLPRPVELSFGTIEASDLKIDELLLARRTIRDFILAAFYSDKVTRSEAFGNDSEYSVMINGSVDANVAQRRVDQVIKAVQKSDLPLTIRRTIDRTVRSKAEGVEPHSQIFYSNIVFDDLDTGTVRSFKSEFARRVHETINFLKTNPARS